MLADQGCRNTVFNAKAQSGADFIERFLGAGIRRFRVDLVDEPAEYVGPLLEWYRRICTADSDSEEELSLSSQIAVPTNPKPRKMSLSNPTAGSGYTSPKSAGGQAMSGTSTVDEAAGEGLSGSSSSGKRKQLVASFLKWMDSVPNGNGRAQGVSQGSLKPTVELDWNKMKPTARR